MGTFLVFVFFYGCALSYIFDAVKGQVIEEVDRGAIGNIKITRGWRARGIALVMSILLFAIPNLLFEGSALNTQIAELCTGAVFAGVIIWQTHAIDTRKYNQRNAVFMKRSPTARALVESLRKMRSK